MFIDALDKRNQAKHYITIERNHEYQKENSLGITKRGPHDPQI